MPIPTPSKEEKKSAFLSRCMGDNVMNNEFTDQKQRYAVCLSKWESKKAKASLVVDLGDDEVAYFSEE